MRSFTSTVIFIFALISTIAAYADIQLPNPGFESPYKTVNISNSHAHIRGQVAEGWSDNSDWADVDAIYQQDKSIKHRGESSQRITVESVSSGAAQFVQFAKLQKDHIYRYSVWLKGKPGASVTMQIRKSGAPYTPYAENTINLSAEWQECRTEDVVTEDDNGVLIIAIKAPMTIWVDDAQFQDLTTAVSTASPKQGNLITNGSFESCSNIRMKTSKLVCGQLPFGWSVRYDGQTRYEYADYRPVIDKTTSVDGQKSLRLDIQKNQMVQVYTPILYYNYNRPHTISVWLKADSPQTYVYIELEKTGVTYTAAVDTMWKRFTFTGVVPYRPYTHLHFVYKSPANSNRTIWIDAVQMEEASQASPDYLPAYPVELSLTIPYPGSIVQNDVKAKIIVGIGSTGKGSEDPNAKIPAGSILKLSATDIFGTNYHFPIVKLPVASIPLPVIMERPQGIFKMHGVLLDKTGVQLSAPVDMIWSRLPKPKDITPEKSFFGIHIPLSPNFIAIARAIGARWVRLHDASMIGKWAAAEPEPGKFEFYDAGINAAHNNGLAILGMLDGAPSYESVKPRATEGYWSYWNIPDKPNALDDWTRYVSTVTAHYKGRIDYWEIWNEPWGEWWLGPGGTPEQYGRFMKAAYNTAKAVNPKAVILGIDTYNSSTWTEDVLKSVGTNYFDYLSFHDYNDFLYGGTKSLPYTSTNKYRELQAKYGTVKPLWNTEGSLFQIASWYAPETGGMEPRRQLGYIVRYDVSYMAAGVKGFNYYAMHLDPAMGDTSCRTNEQDRAIRPILAARAVLASLVDGAGIPKRSEPSAGVDLYTFPSQNGKTVAVVWSYDGSTHTLKIPKGGHILDILGNPMIGSKDKTTVGIEPIYIIH